MELRVYQNDEITIWEPALADVKHLMEKIVRFSYIIDGIKQGDRL